MQHNATHAHAMRQSRRAHDGYDHAGHELRLQNALAETLQHSSQTFAFGIDIWQFHSWNCFLFVAERGSAYVRA